MDPGVAIVNPTEISVMYGYLTDKWRRKFPSCMVLKGLTISVPIRPISAMIVTIQYLINPHPLQFLYPETPPTLNLIKLYILSKWLDLNLSVINMLCIQLGAICMTTINCRSFDVFPHTTASKETYVALVFGFDVTLKQRIEPDSSRKKWNESVFRPPLCTYRLNWARRTSWGWWDDWDDTVLQTQDSKFEPWRSEAEHATSRSRRLPTILTFTRGWGRNLFVSFKPPRPGTEPRSLAWKAAVLTTTLGPPPDSSRNNVAITNPEYISCECRCLKVSM